MSFREELKHYVYDDMRIDPDVRIDKIINKVLDAAWIKIQDEMYSGGELYIDDVEKAIKKLRAEK